MKGHFRYLNFQQENTTIFVFNKSLIFYIKYL
jgi:hypothetical protein